MAEKFIPHDPQAEQSLVSCVWAGFREHDAASPRALGDLSPDAFMVPQARALWTAMRNLYAAAKGMDPVMIHGELQRLGMDGALGGYPGVLEALSHDEWGQPEPLVRRVREMHDRRRMIELASHLDRQARDLVIEPAQAISGLSTDLMGISATNIDRRRRSGADLLLRIEGQRSFRDPSRGQKLWHFPFDSWNEAVEAAPGHVVILAAAPKTGKTALAIDGMVHTAMKGVGVGLISLEMDEDEVESRLASRITGHSATKFLKQDWSQFVVEAARKHPHVYDHMTWWCHPSGVPWARVEAEIREMVRINGVKTVVIDYFTLIGKPSGGKSSSDASLWGSLSTAIKRLAQELGICIILLCQLNREGAEGEPHKWHLRETGQLEQDANAITFLWRESEDGPVFGKVSDNRSGPPVPKKELLFKGDTNVFEMAVRETPTRTAVPGW